MNKTQAKAIILETVRVIPSVLPYLSERTRAALKGGAGSGNFGHEGRPGEVGGSGGGGGVPEGTVRISEIGDKDISSKVDGVCKETGFNPDKVYMSTTMSNVLGEYKTGDDYIVLSPLAMGKQLEGILSHEIAHAQTAETIQEYFRQSRSGESETPIFTALSANIAECLDDNNTRFTDYMIRFSDKLEDDRSIRNKFYVISEGLAERARMRAEGGTYPQAWDDLYEAMKGIK